MSSTTLIRCALPPAAFLKSAATPRQEPLPTCKRAASVPSGAASLPLSETNEALYTQLAPLVRRLIRQYGKTSEMRQDLAGELYCCFHALLEAYDPARCVPLRPYLIRQLNAAAYSYARQQWRLEKRLLSLETDSAPSIHVATEDPTSSWIHALSQEQMFSGLPQALAALPLRQRQAVILRYYEDASFEEIAEALGVQASTARSLLRHGLNKLRISLEYLSHECS